MIDERFVRCKGPLSLKALADLAEAEVVRGNGEALFTHVAPLEEATPQDLSFCHNLKYHDALKNTRAGAVILSSHLVSHVPFHTAILSSPEPLKAFALILKGLYEEKSPDVNIHPTALIHPTAQLGEDCSIGAHAVIEESVIIGKNCTLGSHATLHAHVVMGDNCVIGSHVTLSHTLLGHSVTIKPGARIGQRGFGFFMAEGGEHLSQLQLGRVLIGNHVEIGANTTIDRGSLKDTVIEDFARIDNLVQIAHNVRVGRGAVLVAQVGIAGSTTIGDYSILGGQVGVTGHLTLGKSVKVAAKSGISRNLSACEVVGGIPAVPIQEWRRQVILLKKMGQKGSTESKKERRTNGTTRSQECD